jgi:energy-coupling factor transporter ATP-binding protein EcfA2
LDWQSRAEVASLLAALKKECTLLVVSHDLQEIASLVDYAWEMKPGGTMAPAVWPPALNGEMMGRAWSRQQETRP